MRCISYWHSYNNEPQLTANEQLFIHELIHRPWSPGSGTNVQQRLRRRRRNGWTSERAVAVIVLFLTLYSIDWTSSSFSSSSCVCSPRGRVSYPTSWCPRNPWTPAPHSVTLPFSPLPGFFSTDYRVFHVADLSQLSAGG